MPPIAIPAAVKLVLGAIGAAAVVHWVVKEVRRINEELDRLKAAPASRRLPRSNCHAARIHRAARAAIEVCRA